MNVEELRRVFPDDASCRAFFESVIWPDGPVCPHCQSQRVWRLTSSSVRVGLLECGAIYGDHPDAVSQHEVEPVDLGSSHVFTGLFQQGRILRGNCHLDRRFPEDRLEDAARPAGLDGDSPESAPHAGGG